MQRAWRRNTATPYRAIRIVLLLARATSSAIIIRAWNGKTVMTPRELRKAVAGADVFKISFGKSAAHRTEAFDRGVLVFQCEKTFHEAVLSGDEVTIRRTGRHVKTEKYLDGAAEDQAIANWRQSVLTVQSLPSGSLVVHWEADRGHLHWGLTGSEFHLAREELSDRGQPGLVFHGPLTGAWRNTSASGAPLSNLHPRARVLPVNLANLHRIQTDADYFRALISEGDTSLWERRPDWVEKARSFQGGWRSARLEVLAARREIATPLVKDIADHFFREIDRMTDTALRTAAYGNGQTELVTVKNKDIHFIREELKEEIAALLHKQGFRCALTQYAFARGQQLNPHLLPSLDRIDSSLGYIPGNLQVVTRAANFFKSASNAEDWRQKENAMLCMALALQRARKAELSAALAAE